MSRPEYIDMALEEARNYRDENDATPAEAAFTIAGDYTTPHIEPDAPAPLDILQDVADVHGPCADELEEYTEWATSNDKANAVIEALARRSLEDLLHTELAAEA